MPFPIEEKLVVGVSATALFDFELEHKIFLEQGIEEYLRYQKDRKMTTPEQGGGYPFIRRLLSLNDLFPSQAPIEVVIMSRNHPESGLRIMEAVKAYGLPITRAMFLAGSLPYPYMKSINAVLYLSTNADEVRKAVDSGFPAGYILPSKIHDDSSDKQLRIAFDFDGVIADDEAEKVYAEKNDLPVYQAIEQAKRNSPLGKGPLFPLLEQISKIQSLDKTLAKSPEQRRVRIAIVTARNAPAHERLINTLSYYEISTDELFLLGGIEKKKVLDVLKPHIYFDDQMSHLKTASLTTPSVHIPFGIANALGGSRQF
mgnify:CR=1 FL=1